MFCSNRSRTRGFWVSGRCWNVVWLVYNRRFYNNVWFKHFIWDTDEIRFVLKILVTQLPDCVVNQVLLMFGQVS